MSVPLRFDRYGSTEVVLLDPGTIILIAFFLIFGRTIILSLLLNHDTFFQESLFLNIYQYNFTSKVTNWMSDIEKLQ